MTEEQTQQEEQAPSKIMSPEERRNVLRSALLKAHDPDRKEVTLFGYKLELVQPSMRDMMSTFEAEERMAAQVTMVLRYACVPGTDLRVFEEGDAEVIASWPWNPDMVKLQEAVLELTGIDIEEAEEDLEGNPA